MPDPLNLASASEDYQIDPSLVGDEHIYLPITDDKPDLSPSDINVNFSNLPTDAEIDQTLVTSLAEATSQDREHQPATGTSRVGEEAIPNPNPVVHQAPFVKPARGDDTPYPEHLLFANRVEFEAWLSGESSWCHYVQRRTTTPEKRAEERMRARLKAHERALAGASHNPAFPRQSASDLSQR